MALATAGIAATVGTASPAAAGELTFWTWRQEDRPAYAELFRDFTRQNPDITIRFEAFAAENYNTILSTALAGGKGGDVIHARAYGGIEQFARAGYLMPLDAANVPELANLPADALAAETLRSDNRVYAVPFASQTLGILVNRDAFAKAGVTLPDALDWDGFLAVCRQLKAKGVTPIANGTATAWMDEVFAGVVTAPFIGPALVEDIRAGRTTFEDPRYTAALAKLLDLRESLPPGYTGVDYPTAQQLFISGRAAMFVGGSFEIANFRKQNPKLALDFIAPPSPKPGEPRPVPKFYDGGYAVNAKGADTADALKLVRWMGTPAFGDRLVALLGNISPIKGVRVEDPLLAKVQQLNANSLPYVMAVYFRYETPTGSELLQNGVQRMMAGNVTPQQVGVDLTQGIAKYYAPFRK